MKYDDKVISISEIDTADNTCCLGLRIDAAPLAASIADVGLINPPVLKQKKLTSQKVEEYHNPPSPLAQTWLASLIACNGGKAPGQAKPSPHRGRGQGEGGKPQVIEKLQKDNPEYRIVCGFRRIEACRSLGWRKIKVRVLPGDLSEVELLKLAILDNRSHRPLNVVEQARGIEKLKDHIPSANRLEALSSLLGFPPNKKVFKKLSMLSRLPELIQAAVPDGAVSFEAAADLSEFSPEDALSFFDLFKWLKMSQNKQTQIITLVQEIAIRENLRPAQVLLSKDISTILDRADLNRNEKGSAIRAYLKRRRFPTLAQAQERYLKELKALKLNEHIHMTAPAYFEDGIYTLRMSFKSMKDFDKRRQSLDAMAKNPALKRILENKSELKCLK
ncbi:MAG: ParB N-terminal domain-containing protein [Desulfobacterales bacterium]|nr:ParB N-terminal domain-containing protein [Desulfobacterales bacterium]